MQFPQYGCSERSHNACFPRIYAVFQNAPLYRKKCQKENDSFSYRFPFDTPFSAFFGFSAGFKAGFGNDADTLASIFIEYADEYVSRYKEEDEVGRYFWDTFKRKSGKQYYPITCPDGTVLQYEENGEPISWLRSEPRFLSDLKE